MLVTALLLSVTKLVSQTEADSLKATLPQMPADSFKVNTYNRLAYLHTYYQPALIEARSYADSALQLSQKLGYTNGLANAKRSLGLVDMKEGNFSSALKQLEEYQDFYAATGDSGRIINALYSIAIIYGYLGNYQEKLRLQLHMVHYHEQRKDTNNLARALMSLGSTYSALEQFDKAKFAHTQAANIFKNKENSFGYAMALQNLANVYQYIQSFDSAAFLYEEALTFIKDLGIKEEEAYIITNLGSLYQELGQNQKALDFQLEALVIWESLNQPKDIAEASYYVGQAYLKLKSYEEAFRYLQVALRESEELGLKRLTADIYEALSELEETRKNFQMALHYSKFSNQLNDTLFSEENTRQINELQTKYETTQKDQQITLLAKEKEIQEKETSRQSTLKQAFIIGGVLVALLAGLLLYNSRLRLRNQQVVAAKNQEVKEANFQRQVSELEMKALQAQINPHFIFNCLNSIYQMILEGQDTQASRYLTKFSKLIRLILENAESAEITLQEELMVLESYIELEKLRFQGNIDYQLTVDSKIDPEDTYLPSMVLQPFVENAIWHGLMPKPDQKKGCITVEATKRGDFLVCQIEDNGVGRAKSQELQNQSVWKSKSLGLKITEERLSLLDRDFNRKLIQITDLKDSSGQASGTRVEVSIPS